MDLFRNHLKFSTTIFLFNQKPIIDILLNSHVKRIIEKIGILKQTYNNHKLINLTEKLNLWISF